MALKSAPINVTVPAVSYVEQDENRTARIVITTPKAAGSGIAAPNDVTKFRVETWREVITYRDGDENRRSGVAFNPSISDIMAHPDGPTVLTLLPKILDDLYTASQNT